MLWSSQFSSVAFVHYHGTSMAWFQFQFIVRTYFLLEDTLVSLIIAITEFSMETYIQTQSLNPYFLLESFFPFQK